VAVEAKRLERYYYRTDAAIGDLWPTIVRDVGEHSAGITIEQRNAFARGGVVSGNLTRQQLVELAALIDRVLADWPLW
jgi:hypothetical protein